MDIGQKHGVNAHDVTIFFCQDGRPYAIDCSQMDDSIVILMTAALKRPSKIGFIVSHEIVDRLRISKARVIRGS
jgi:hypothetical protein